MTGTGWDRERILRLLSELAMGVVSFRLYGGGHPRTVEAVTRVSETLERLLAGSAQENLTILELQGQLVVEAQPVSHLGPQAAVVARAMRRAELERITVSRGVQPAEVKALLAFLAQPDPPPPDVPHVVMGMVELAGGEAGAGEGRMAGRPEAMLRDRVRLVGEALEGLASREVGALPLAEDVVEQLDRRGEEVHPLELLAPLDGPESWPAVHSHNVAALAVSTAHILGLRRSERLDLGLAGLLHDVGRVEQREAWLEDLALEGDRLEGDPEHPLRGLEITLVVPGLPRLVPVVVVEHHLDLEGRGIPGFSLARSPHPAASLVGALETLDVLHTVRGPAGKVTREGAVAWVQERSGAELDPFLAGLLVALLETAPPD